MAIKVGSCTVIDDTRNLANVCSISLVSGNQGTSGQVLQSQGTGQPSTWATVSSITNFEYNSRNDLRTTTPSDGAQAFVEDLGYFSFNLASDEPDDDEDEKEVDYPEDFSSDYLPQDDVSKMSKDEIANAIIDAYQKGDEAEIARLRRMLPESYRFPRFNDYSKLFENLKRC